MLRFGSSGLQLDALPPVSSGESSSSPTTTVSSAPLTSSHRGSLESWRSFAQPKYQQKHPWLVLKPEGIYCQYCCAHQPRAGANVFVALPYTGNRSDKLLQHERSGVHQASLTLHQESLLRSATSTTIREMVVESAVITADETAFSDALRCMYFLMKGRWHTQHTLLTCNLCVFC